MPGSLCVGVLGEAAQGMRLIFPLLSSGLRRSNADLQHITLSQGVSFSGAQLRACFLSSSRRCISGSLCVHVCVWGEEWDYTGDASHIPSQLSSELAPFSIRRRQGDV